MRTRILQEDLRPLLQQPAGVFFRGKVHETLPQILRFIATNKPKLIITVGDEASKLTVHFKASRWITITDGLIERTPVGSFPLAGTVFKTRNPPGQLTPEARRTVQKAIRTPGRLSILVDGEEDLLTLAAMIYAPLGTVVIYGQPKEGAVMVKIDRERIEFARSILRRMKTL